MNLYEFYVDGDKFYDVRIDELALIEPILELRQNSAGTFTFTIPPNHPKYNSFEPLISTIEIYRDGEWFWEGKLIEKHSDFENKLECTVEGALGYLNDSIQPQDEFHNITPIGYVERLLNVHNSMVAENRKIYLGAVTVKDPNNSMYRYTNYNSTLQELKEDIIDDLGGIIRLRKRDGKLYLDILDEPDRTCSQIIRLGQNLIDLAPSFDFKDVKSIIIPLGAALEDQEEHDEGLEALDKYVEITEVNNGKNYIARQDLLDKYKNIWGVVHFSDIHTPENLLRKAKEYLTDGQWGEMVIEAKAFDLNYTDEEFQEFRLNDKVRVKSEYHGIDRYFPLTALTLHFNDVAQNTITLGGTGEPVSITGVTNQVTINTQKLSDRVKDPNRLIQQAIYQATELINQGLNGYVRVNGNEILIMDTDDPATAKHVWRWNMGGLGYSNNGYNGPFETAITMDGTIVGSFIAANTIAAEQIDVNYTDHVTKEGQKYVDGKLVNYYTTEQTETYFRNEAGKWEMGVLQQVNETLNGYTTTEYFESQLSLTEDRFNTTLKDYSTTKNVQSMIDQTAESITTSVSDKIDDCYSEIKQTKDEITTTLKGYATTGELETIEQKVTTDGIFTTINNGLAGTKNFKTTKFTMDKNGLTIQNGAFTIENSDGTKVLYANTDGQLFLSGIMETMTTSTSKAKMRLASGALVFYDKNGNQAGSFGGYTVGSSNEGIAMNTVSTSMRPMRISTKSNYIDLDSSGISIRTDNTLTINAKSLKARDSTTSMDYTAYNGLLTVGNTILRFVNGLCIGRYE